VTQRVMAARREGMTAAQLVDREFFSSIAPGE
jgi:hypothetical protein